MSSYVMGRMGRCLVSAHQVVYQRLLPLVWVNTLGLLKEAAHGPLFAVVSSAVKRRETFDCIGGHHRNIRLRGRAR